MRKRGTAVKVSGNKRMHSQCVKKNLPLKARWGEVYTCERGSIFSRNRLSGLSNKFLYVLIMSLQFVPSIVL